MRDLRLLSKLKYQIIPLSPGQLRSSKKYDGLSTLLWLCVCYFGLALHHRSDDDTLYPTYLPTSYLTTRVKQLKKKLILIFLSMGSKNGP